MALQLNFLIELDPPIVTKSAVAIPSRVHKAFCPFATTPTPLQCVLNTNTCATATAMPPGRRQYTRLTSIQTGPRRWDARVLPTEIHI
jgi:hypothetical protein